MYFKTVYVDRTYNDLFQDGNCEKWQRVILYFNERKISMRKENKS